LTVSFVEHVTIVTVSALTLGGTSGTTVVTFAVFLNAMGFFACTALGWYESLDAFEVAWVSVVCHHLGGLDLMFITGMVVTARTRALTATHLSLVETIAVQFQTADFRAFTALAFRKYN
jgi:hypothetical protein